MYQAQAASTAPTPAVPGTPTVQGTVQPATTIVQPLPSGPYTAAEMYEAAQTQRRLVREQLANAEAEREEIAQQLRQPNVTGVDREGLEAQVRAMDARILELRQNLAQAQTLEAQTAAMPGSTEQSPAEAANERAEMLLAGALTFTFVVVLPLVLVQARRLWKKHSVVLTMTPELNQRLDAIDRAVEATAIEIERVGEGQRFVTQLLASRAVETPQIPRKEP